MHISICEHKYNKKGKCEFCGATPKTNTLDKCEKVECKKCFFRDKILPEGYCDCSCHKVKPEGVGEWEKEWMKMAFEGATLAEQRDFIKNLILQEKAKWNKPLGISEWKKMGEDRGYFDYLSKY